MNELERNLFMLMNDWYGRIQDLVEALECLGLEVQDQTCEYLVAANEDLEVEIFLGGTSDTITIEDIKILNA